METNGEKDAYGEKLRNIGRSIGDMDENEIRDYDEEKYNDMKNECNSFYSSDRDYEDEDDRQRRNNEDDNDDDDDDDDDDDELDRIYKHRHNKRKRNKNKNNNEHDNQKNVHHTHNTIFFIMIFLAFIIIIFTILIFFNVQITNLTGINLIFFRNIQQKLKFRLKKSSSI